MEDKKEQKPMEREERRKGISRRGFLKILGAAAIGAAASQALPNFGVSAGETQIGGTLFGDIKPVEGKVNIDTSEDMPGKSAELSRRLEGQQLLSSLPTATLTEGETKALTEAFPDVKDSQFSNVFSNVSVDNTGRVTGLPFEKDSKADKLAQSYQAIIASATQLDGAPEVLVGRNTEKDTIAIIVRNTQPFTAKGENTQKSYKKNSFLYIDQTNSFGYLELTDRPGGEKDVLKLFAVDKPFQDNVQRFYVGPKENPQQLKAPDIGEFTVAQVDEKKNAQVVTISGFGIPLFDTGDPSIPKATPQPGTSSDLPTPSAPEIRAKVAEPDFSSVKVEVSRDRKTITIDGREYPVIPLPDSFNLALKNGTEIHHPNLGVYELLTPKNITGFAVISIVAGTRMRNVEGVNLPVVDIVTFQSSGKVKKVETTFLPVVNLDGKSMSWDDAKGELTPGRVIDIESNVTETEKTYDNETLQKGVDGFKKLGFDIDVATLKAWNDTGRGTLNTLKNFNSNKSTDPAQIGMGWIVRTKPN